MKNEVRFLSLYQLIGGVFGLVTTLLAWNQMSNPAAALLSILFFGYSTYCGWILMKHFTVRTLKFSFYNQLLQVLIVSFFGVSYKFGAGVMVNIGCNFMNLESGFSIRSFFHFNLSRLTLTAGGNENIVTLGVNLVALFLVFYIIRLRRKSF